MDVPPASADTRGDFIEKNAAIRLCGQPRVNDTFVVITARLARKCRDRVCATKLLIRLEER